MRELGSGSRGRNYCQYRDFSVPNFDTPPGPPRREGGVSNIMVLLLALKENVQKSPREKRVVCTCNYPQACTITVVTLHKGSKHDGSPFWTGNC